MNLVPVVVDKEVDGDRCYDIYSKLLKNRIIMLSGEINDNIANTIIAELLYLDSLSHDDISIYINSPGGSVTSGLAIYDTMNFIKSDVVTIGTGMCASMAAVLLSSGTKGKRKCLKNSEVMIHQVIGGCEGQATDIKIQSDHILKLKKRLNEILSHNSNKKLKDVENDTERDHYLDSKEALEYGLIDEII